MSGIRGGGLALTLAVLATGCVRHTAPPDFLADPAEAQRTAFGGWADVSFRGAGGVEHASGELIAATSDSLWILSPPGHVIPVADIVDGELVGYDARAEQVGGAVALGVVSTISNGAFLIFTAPMWLIGGSVAARSQGQVAIDELPAARWEALAAFARFPQGMPEGIELADLRPVRR
jgi:hypothetical protein